jgi:hypothetical protein
MKKQNKNNDLTACNTPITAKFTRTINLPIPTHHYIKKPLPHSQIRLHSTPEQLLPIRRYNHPLDNSITSLDIKSLQNTLSTQEPQFISYPNTNMIYSSGILY